MRVQVMTSGAAVPQAWQRRIEERVRATLARFAHRLEEARLRLKRVRGPRGYAEQEAVIEVDLARGESIRIKERGGAGRSAIRRALRRLAAVTARRLARRRALRRRAERARSRRASDR